MEYANLFLCSLLSLLLGFTLVRYLTCHPVSMSLYLLLTCLLGFIIILLLCRVFRNQQIFGAALVVFLIFFLAGYFYTLHSFMNISEERTLPEVLRSKRDWGKGHTAVIVLAHGEPETYDPGAWIRQMMELDQQGVAFVPYPFRPFFFNSLREKYLMAGKSGHNAECLQVMKDMEAEYRKNGDMGTRFYISYLENEPLPDTAAIEAINDGASEIILCNIFVTISNHTQEAINMIKPLQLEDYGVKIKYTKPLYDSKILQRLYVDSVNRNTASLDRKKAGVILVGHGQPEEWDKEFPTETQQEISFRTEIIKALELEGYDSRNLKLAWMEFREPKPEAAINQLVENGVIDIFYFSTIIGSESIHAKYDIPRLMNRVKTPDKVKLQQLTAFDDKAGIVKALIERIKKCK